MNVYFSQTIENIYYDCDKIDPRFHPENLEPLSQTNPRIDIKIDQFIDRVRMPHLNLVIKGVSNQVLVKGKMNHGLIDINIPRDVAQLPGSYLFN
jgi:hypothetical protein